MFMVANQFLPMSDLCVKESIGFTQLKSTYVCNLQLIYNYYYCVLDKLQQAAVQYPTL